MEVHHLVQEADGGANSLENAIPLCFDCHADAGHYNSRHPKGTKFSIPELTNARDDWYKLVSKKSIPEKLVISEHLQSSYYILHTLGILEKTLSKDFSSINKFRAKTYLASNEISSYWKDILKTHKKDFKWNVEQNLMVEMREFSSLEEYKSAYNNYSIVNKGAEDYPYYEATREVTWEELLQAKFPNSFVTLLSNSGFEARDICTALLRPNEDGCGDGNSSSAYIEYLEIAPLSFVFLGITNVSRKPIKLQLLKTDKQNHKLPNFNVLPMEMLLIPLSTVTNAFDIDRESICLEHTNGERGEDFSKVLNPININTDNIKNIGGKINPLSIIYNDNEGEYEVEIHKLDFNNLYSINSYWQCGSCPHLFYKTNDGLQRYSRELLVASSNKSGKDYFTIPPKVTHVIIRELEDEITYLDKVLINEIVVFENKVLNKGDFLEFKVNTNDKVEIIGKYVPFQNSISNTNDFWFRNQLIINSNKAYNKKGQLTT
ncbi:hypothetical protein AWN68_12605 [Roseivirga echinicomitans]|uniref:HNH domain-containing protein n=2 Tax=Roseivirga echinicomitans TaxID=296218 RepID=A0A150XV62_9BACT|nr:hypothetical protein AWN68_12605 [Roseivirga echinicomitans]